MVRNAITEEIRDIRHGLAAECGNDVYRIGAELRVVKQHLVGAWFDFRNALLPWPR